MSYIWSERNKVVNALVPSTDRWNTNPQCDIVHLENFNKCTFLIMTGASADNINTVTVQAGATSTGASFAVIDLTDYLAHIDRRVSGVEHDTDDGTGSDSTQPDVRYVYDGLYSRALRGSIGESDCAARPDSDIRRGEKKGRTMRQETRWCNRCQYALAQDGSGESHPCQKGNHNWS